LLNATFFNTIAHLKDLPFESGHEVAFVGRSNAGKSSAINTIAHHKRLAFVSKTPGRTQHLNFFRVGPDRFLVDLPGYGFAKAPLVQQNAWQSLIGGYLIQRPQLRGLVLIMDIRHPLTDLDRQLLAWFGQTGKPVLCLLSKCDKLARGPMLNTLRQVQAELDAMAGLQARAIVFSSPRRVGVEEAETVIREWLEMTRQ